MEKLYEILKKIRPEVNYEKEKRLVDDGLLDSFDIVSIVSVLNDEFDIKIDVTDIYPDNFNSADAIWRLIEKYQ